MLGTDANFFSSIGVEFKMFSTGERVTLHYPTVPLVGVVPDFVPRTFQVRSIRDLVTCPLSVRDYLDRPLINRGRILINGWDLDHKSYRRFYLASSKEFRRESVLRIGLYDADQRQPFKVIDRPFAPTRRDRLMLAKRLIRIGQMETENLKIGVFADDLLVVKAA